MDWIGNLFSKLVEAFRKNRLSTIEQLEKTRAKVLRRFFKKSKKKQLRKLRKDLPHNEFQEHIINEANENLEQQNTDQERGSILERGESKESD